MLGSRSENTNVTEKEVKQVQKKKTLLDTNNKLEKMNVKIIFESFHMK